MTIIAATGLKREAQIVDGPYIVCAVGGGDALRFHEKLDALLTKGANGVLSIGIAGGLAPGLKAGDCVAATRVVTKDKAFPTDPDWTNRIVASLGEIRSGTIYGSDTIVADVETKARLNKETSALAVDMESHIAARVARGHGVPFAALRIISDSATHVLPPAALVAMKKDGGINLPAVLWSVLTKPSQIPALIRTGRDSNVAFASLLRARKLLGGGFGAMDLG
jgi:hopanoid-associated phosphorylase